MTCHDARERFSELVDERLAARDRAEVDAHVVDCAACRAELDALRGTIALVRSIGPARAPAGFADRVVAAASTVAPIRAPRQRLLDRLLFPLPVKLPLEAAAVMLVGVAVAYLFQHTPELRQAAQVEAPVVTEQRAAPATPTPVGPAAPAESLAPPPVTSPPASDTRERDQLGARADSAVMGQKKDAPEPARKAEAPASSMDAPRSEPPAPATDVAPPPAAAAPSRPQMQTRQQAPGGGSAPQAQDGPQQRVLRDAARAKEAAPAETSPRILSTGESRRAMAKSVVAPDLSGALVVASRLTAESALRELVARHRGQVLEWTADASATTLEAQVPRAALAAFVTDLQTLGRWRVDHAATSVVDPVRVTIRLSE